jgi:hypothetical protein
MEGAVRSGLTAARQIKADLAGLAPPAAAGEGAALAAPQPAGAPS